MIEELVLGNKFKLSINNNKNIKNIDHNNNNCKGSIIITILIKTYLDEFTKKTIT